MIFAAPIFGLLFPLVALVWWLARNRRKQPSILIPQSHYLSELSDKTAIQARQLSPFLKALALFCLIIALMQPQKIETYRREAKSGIDILLIVDTSSSMNAEDFKPKNRLEVAKSTITTFAKNRQSDRLGLIVFGRDAYTQVPLTLDHDTVLASINKLKIGQAGDGTAIGVAIATGINRLKNSATKNKLIILLTDGENNSGEIDPKTAASLAKEMRIKVYTIGIGKVGGAKIPFTHPNFGKRYARNQDGSYAMTKLDEPTLMEIAEISQASYFRATNSTELEKIYQDINALEPSKLKPNIEQQITEMFSFFLKLSLFLLLLEWGLSSFIGRSAP